MKKLFSKRGVLASLRAYGYASIVCTGPMLLSVALLLGVRYISSRNGANGLEQELLNSMFTYTLLASLTVSSLLSMLTTRYTADMLFIEKKERVLPSLYGSITVSLVLGSVFYGIFLLNSGIERHHQILCFILFAELVVIWIQINYITALKDYKSILLAFFTSILLALVFGVVLSRMGIEVVSALIIAVIAGYGVMMSWNFMLLHRYFPKGQGSAFQFLELIDRYPKLLWIGFFTTLGLFGHLVIMWFSPLRVQVKGLFYGAPAYDVPALFAFLSILITTVNFVTSVEVNFYPRYRQYFSLFNGKGALSDVQRAETEMLTVLKQELYYLALRQVFATILFIVVGGPILVGLNMGFTEAMFGTFRILCVGYGLYAIANSIMLIQLYFADNQGAFLSSVIFVVAANIGTLMLMNGDYQYYGFGFLVGSFVMYMVAWMRLMTFIKKLDYHILCSQPVLQQVYRGFFTKLADYLERVAAKRHAVNESEQRGNSNENKISDKMA